MQPSKARPPMLVRPLGTLISARPREAQSAKAKAEAADARETVGQAGQCEGGAATEGAPADASEAVGQAGQREGAAVVEGVAADAGEAVG